MAIIKSSADHLTLNADGVDKAIKFKANGVEKASISSAGAFTSTSIDATKLTGALPAISGASLTSLTSGNLTGALPAISGASLTNLPGGGKVLQVVQGSINTSNLSTTSTSYVAGNATVSITPSSTSSKILVIATGAWYKPNNGTHSNYNEGYYKLYRGSVSNMLGSEMRIGASMYDMQSTLGAGIGRIKGHISLNYLDSPNTTSATTYGIAARIADSENGGAELNQDYLIALEIGA